MMVYINVITLLLFSGVSIESQPLHRKSVVATCDVIDLESQVIGQKKELDGIDELFMAWELAIRQQDSNQIASLVSEDAEFWTNGLAPLIGREALKGVFEDFLDMYEYVQIYDCHELMVRGNRAFVRGIEHNQKTPKKGGGVIHTKQRTFSVLSRDKQGVWRFTRGMSNALPAASAES